jgi:hypothetical protein
MRSRLAGMIARQRVSVVVAVVLALALAGTAFAAVRGQAWRVGYIETIATYATGLSANVASSALQIYNSSTSSAARAIFARNNSTAGTILAQNLGAGPAANFLVRVTTPRGSLHGQLIDQGHVSQRRLSGQP